MLEINDHIRIPDEELSWTFARSGGPGGQNVNKVASKAILHWNAAESPQLPPEVKRRLQTLQRRRFTKEGVFVIISQRFRDQERNRQDCLEKLRDMLLEATIIPKARRATRPTRGSREARLRAKKARSALKTRRRVDPHDE
jgi:ribosome-associated protein